MNRPIAAPAPRVQPRRLWRRYFLQFSLRTLLGVMTLSAIGCWWFLQPKVQEQELAGKYLRLRCQVRTIHRPKVASAPQPRRWFRPPRMGSLSLLGPPTGQLVNTVAEGKWQLRNERQELVAAGRYQANETHGRWTIYHANGKIA